MQTTSPSESRKDFRAVVTIDSTGRGDFVSIEAALKKALPYSYLFVQPGRYEESFEINVPVTIAGHVGDTGGVVEIYGSVVVNCPTPDAIVLRDLKITMPSNFSESLPPLFTDQTTEFLPGSNQSQLEDEENDQISSRQGVALLILSGNVSLEHCHIEGGRGTGIQSWESQYNLSAYDCDILHSHVGVILETSSQATFDHCRIHGMERLGLWSGRGTVLKLLDSTISNGIGAGLLLEGCRSALIESCEIFDWSRSGLLAREVLSLKISKTKIYRNSQNGICLAKRSQCTIQESQFTANSWHNVAVIDNVNAEFIDCHIAESLQTGMAIAKDSRVWVKKSHLSENLKSGLSVRSGSTATLEDCTVIRHAGIAIDIGAKSNVILERTQVTKNGLGQHQAAILHQEDGHLSIQRSQICHNYAAIDRDSSAVTMIRFSNVSGNRHGVWMNFDSEQHRSNLSLFMVYQGWNLRQPSPPRQPPSKPSPQLSQESSTNSDAPPPRQSSFFLLIGTWLILCILLPYFSHSSNTRITDREAEVKTLKQQLEQQEIDRQSQSSEKDRMTQENKIKIDEANQKQQRLAEQLEQQKQKAEAEAKKETIYPWTMPPNSPVETSIPPRPEPALPTSGTQPEPVRTTTPRTSSRTASVPAQMPPAVRITRPENPIEPPLKLKSPPEAKIPPSSIPNSNLELDVDEDPAPP
jgi:Right handed beta helix region